eukprot:4170199-Prymnesium_polylepis.1
MIRPPSVSFRRPRRFRSPPLAALRRSLGWVAACRREPPASDWGGDVCRSIKESAPANESDAAAESEALSTPTSRVRRLSIKPSTVRKPAPTATPPPPPLSTSPTLKAHSQAW